MCANNKCCLRMWRKGDPSILLMGLLIVVTTVETSLEVHPKLKIEIPYDTEILCSGMYPKKMKTPIQKGTWGLPRWCSG